MAKSCRVYIQRLSPNEDVQQKLQEWHNSIFKELKDSKLFRAWNGIEFLASAGDSRYPKAKALISSINQKWGVNVAGTAFTQPTGREYVFVNVRNLLQKAEQEAIPTPSQGKLFEQKTDEIGKTIPSRASKETLERIKEFLKRVGINWDGINERAGVAGSADILHNLISVSEGKEDVVLTEEAMHFAVEIIEQTNPQLFNQMLSQIGDYQLYRDTLNLYRGTRLYMTKEGKPDIRKIKKEAIGKVLAETVVRLNDGSTEKPELLAKTPNWWKQIINWIKSLMGKAGFNPFEVAAEKVLFEDIGTVADLENSKLTVDLANRILAKIANNKDITSQAIKDYIKKGERRLAIAFLYDQLHSTVGDKSVDNTAYDSVMQILKGDTQLAEDIADYRDVYLQQEEGAVNLNSKRDQIFNAFKAESRKIVRLEDVENNEKYYEYEGTKVPDTVTKKVKRTSRKWDRVKTELQESVDEAKQQLGIAGHEDIKDIADRYIDPETGLRRDTPLPRINPSQINPSDSRIYNALEANFVERLNIYPPGTKFLTEIAVVDKNRTLGSTIDFMAILPDKDGAQVDILDWKFRELNTNRFKDIPFWNVEDWRKQMTEYKKIAKDYGVKEYQFRKTEMIPIITTYAHQITNVSGRAQHTGSVIQEIITSPIKVKIGDALYTLPVPLEEQSTGFKRVDEYLKRLNAIYKKEQSKKATEGEKQARTRKLEALFGAIRALHVANNIDPLLTQAEQYMLANQAIITKAESVIAGIRDNTQVYFEEQKEEVAAELKDLYRDISVYDDMDIYLKEVAKNAEDEESKNTLSRLLIVAEEIRTFKKNLEDTIKEYLKEQGREMGIANVTAPERTVRGLKRLFRALSEATTHAVEFFYRLESPVKQKLAVTADRLADEYKSLRDKVDEYRKSNGLDWKNVFDKLIVKGTNMLISRVKPEFYESLAKAAETGDFQWIRDNIDIDRYLAWYEEAWQTNEDFLEREYPGDGVRETEQREYHRSLFESRFNIENASALSNNKLKVFFKEKWHSKEYVELHKKGNEVLLEIYNKANALNKEYAQEGLLPERFARRFLPFVRKTYAEKFAFGGKISVFENFLASISVDVEHEGQGMRDPRTGQLIDRIPIFFMRDFVKEKAKKGEEPDYSKVSGDIVKNLMMYEMQLERYKAYSEIESRAELLAIMEKAKGSLQTNAWGEVIREFSDNPEKPGAVKVSEDNERNFKLLEAQIKNRIYGQRYINEDHFDQKIGKIGSAAAKKVNKFFGVQLLPEDLEGRHISFTKLIQTFNRYFGMKTMGLNVPVALTVFGGGTFQNLINSGRFFNRKDYTKAFMRLATKSFNGEDGKKAAALIDHFFPMLDNQTRLKMRGASATAAQQFSLSDKMYYLMRNFSRVVENTSFLALAENTMVRGGEFVNINTYVRGLEKYHNMHKLPQAERDALTKEMNEEIDKYKREESLINGGSEIVNDELVIKGIPSREHKGVYKFREFVQQISKDAVGNTTEEDMNLIRMSILGTSFMMFKNWIPRLVDMRLGELRYTPGKDAYEWGRMRMMYQAASINIFETIKNIRGIITGNDHGMQLLHKMYEKKIQEYARVTGMDIDDITLDEAQFIEMVRAGIKSQVDELKLLVSLVTIYISIPPPDPDDTDETKGIYAFTRKSMDKIMNEIAFFYSPNSLVNIANGSLFPSLGLLTDIEKVVYYTGREIYAIGVGDQELEEKNKVWKYVFRTAPITKEMLQYIAIFNKDMADDLGVKLQAPQLFDTQH